MMKTPVTIITSKKLTQLTSAQTEALKLRDETTKATDFIKKIENGDLNVNYATESEIEEGSLADALLSMQKQMKKIALEEKQRNWVSEGLAKFIEILRTDNEQSEKLYDNIIASLVKYMNVNQGGLFVVNDNDEHDTYLELVACYAYDRKKYLNKRIEIGEGLIGQCYLEGDSIFLTELPAGYMQITSGLGDSQPKCLLIAPLKLNDKIYGVIELASFSVLEEYRVGFVEKLAESIAATISGTSINRKTRQLLEIAQEQTEQMRAQEEELKQSMEELTAMQEAVQQKQRESEMTAFKYEQILENCADCVITIDEMGIISFFNQSAEKLWGYSRDEVIGKNVKMLMGTEHSTRHDLYLNNYKNTGIAKVIGKGREVEALQKNGHFVPILLTLSQSVMHGTPIYTAFIKDITLQKELEYQAHQQMEELKAQEEEIRQNMEELTTIQEEMERKSIELTGMANAVNSTLATIEFAMDKSILVANDNFLHVMGYTLDEIKGKKHAIFLDEKYRDSAEYSKFWDNLNEGIAQLGEVKRIAKNGHEVWLNASYTPVFNNDGKPFKVIKFAQDITGQKKLALDFERQLEAISKSYAVIELGMGGEILTANDNFLALMGYTGKEIVGKHHSMFVLPEDASHEDYKQFWEKLKNGEYVSGEFRRKNKNGHEIWIKGSYNPILDLNGKPYKVVKFAQDITLWKQNKNTAIAH